MTREEKVAMVADVFGDGLMEAREAVDVLAEATGLPLCRAGVALAEEVTARMVAGWTPPRDMGGMWFL